MSFYYNKRPSGDGPHWAWLRSWFLTLPSGDDNDPAIKVNRILTDAYRRARTYDDEEDVIRCLKKNGVILPNNFQPMEPMCDIFGESLIDEWIKQLKNFT